MEKWDDFSCEVAHDSICRVSAPLRTGTFDLATTEIFLFLKKKNRMISFIFSTAKPRSRPILQKGLPKNTTVRIGDNATMTCIVLVSGTLPDFRWLKWDKSVTSTKTISDDLENRLYRLVDPHSYKSIRVKDHFGCELTIINVKEDDLGLYTCYVSNHVGSDYSSAFLSKDEKPSAPAKGVQVQISLLTSTWYWKYLCNISYYAVKVSIVTRKKR